MKAPLILITALAGVPMAHAADVESGEAKVTAVCAACHGGNGVSVANSIPHLAGQRADYLIGQLKAFKAGERKDDLMNAIASQLNEEDMQNVAAYLASLPGAPSGAAQSQLLPAIAPSRVNFPDDYKASFTRYHTMDFPDRKQVHYFYANPAAVKAAATDDPLPGGSTILVEVFGAKLDEQEHPVRDPDGHIAPDEILGYGVMERQAGWGTQIPEILRNDDWNYASFSSGRTRRDGFNHAVCLACHKPQRDEGYLFTMKQLRASVRGE